MEVTDYLEAIESDMSVFHRVDDIYEMDCLRFFRLAFKLAYYQGAVRAQAEQRSANEEGYSDEYPTQQHQHGSVTSEPVRLDLESVAGKRSEADARMKGLPWIEYG